MAICLDTSVGGFVGALFDDFSAAAVVVAPAPVLCDNGLGFVVPCTRAGRRSFVALFSETGVSEDC